MPAENKVLQNLDIPAYNNLITNIGYKTYMNILINSIEINLKNSKQSNLEL